MLKRMPTSRTARRFAIALLLLLLQCRIATAQECTADGRCDAHERCPVWKADGECIRAPVYMAEHCPASCADIEDEGDGAETAAPNDAADGVACADRHENCAQWAALGECDENADLMPRYCPLSCGRCEAPPSSCADQHENCAFWAKHGECANNAPYMKTHCPVACKTCDEFIMNVSEDGANAATEQRQTSSSSSSDDDEDDAEFAEVLKQTTAFGTLQTVEGERRAETAAQVTKSVAYMQSAQFRDLSDVVRDNCLNRHEHCAFWAILGECEKNAGYMKINCAPSCLTCHLIDMDARCPKLGLDVEPALQPGDLNALFDRIVRNAPGNRTLSDAEVAALAAAHTPHYTVRVHSRPDDGGADQVPPSVTSVAHDRSMPPWVITLDDFVTPDECAALIQLGHDHVYARSEDVGAIKFDGTHGSVRSERRTSENAWCSTLTGCRDQDVPARLHDRMSAVMGIPADHSEDLQMLKYEVGQF